MKNGPCRIAGCTLSARSKRNRLCEAHSKHQSGRKAHSSAMKALLPGEWEAMYWAQDMCCAICGKLLWNRYSGVPRNKETEKVAAVDHDKFIAKEKGMRASIRGLICSMPCNRGLHDWMYKNEGRWLRKAVMYCGEKPAQVVLRRLGV